MKKILLSASLLMGAFMSQAQFSSMTVINHAPCDVQVVLYAEFPWAGFGPCALQSQRFSIAAGATLSASTYWDWDAIVPYASGTTPPSPVTAPSGTMTAPTFGAAGCFLWKYAQIIPAYAAGGGPYTGPGSPNDTWGTPGGSACVTPSNVGTPCAGAPGPSASSWVNVGGDVTLTIN